MNRWSLLALLLGLLLVSAPFTRVLADEYGDEEDDEEGPAKGDDEEKDVVVLTNGNFDSIISKSKFALVEFYAPWCGHCKSLKPHYAKAATALKAITPDVVIAKLDATAEGEAAAKFKIEGYPTIKWFVDGEVASDYNGGRDAEGIIKWVSKKAGPPAHTVQEVSKLKELEASNGIIVVGYFSAFEGDAYDLFKSLAKKSEDATYVETTSAEVAAEAGITAAPGVAAVKNFDGEDREIVPFTAALDDLDTLKAFVVGEKLPLTIEFNQANSEKIFNSGIQKQIIFWSTAADLAPGSEKLALLKAVSKKYKGKLVFVTVNSESEGSEPVTNFFGLKDASPPQIVGFFMEKNKKYSLQGELTAESIEAFAQSVYDGTAQAQFKSQPIPEDNKDGDVTIIVGKTVESIVLDPKKDVLLEIYAPWCGHCKKLDPIYKKLAKRFKKVDSVVIAKMDGTENEHGDIDVKGFPTILLFPAGDKTPITFEGGDRSLKALTKFIKQHAKIPYELPKKGGGDESGHDEL